MLIVISSRGLILSRTGVFDLRFRVDYTSVLSSIHPRLTPWLPHCLPRNRFDGIVSAGQAANNAKSQALSGRRLGYRCCMARKSGRMFKGLPALSQICGHGPIEASARPIADSVYCGGLNIAV